MPARTPGARTDETVEETRSVPSSGCEIVGLLKRAISRLQGQIDAPLENLG